MLTDYFIKTVLHQLHPDLNSFTKEGFQIIHTIFDKFNNKSSKEILDLIKDKTNNGHLYQYAEREADKKPREDDKIKNVIEYLLAETSELSGNATIDDHKKNIGACHIWRAIYNDDELRSLFQDDLPKICNTPCIKDEIIDKYKSNCRPRLNKIKDLLDENNINYENIIIKLINYIIINFVNMCPSDDFLEKMIKEIDPNETTISIIQLHQSITLKLIEKMKSKDAKINYSLLNDSFCEAFPLYSFN